MVDARTPRPAGYAGRDGRAAEPVGRGFVLMIACCMGMTAMSIDVLLPAFGEMRTDFGLPSDSTAVSRLITSFLLGLAVGQIVYGPLSDRFGRKRPLYVGL